MRPERAILPSRPAGKERMERSVTVEPPPRRTVSDGRILVVDDDPSICETLTTMLQFKGFETVASHDGADALEKARRDPPDLILLDVMMPEMDGLEVCREIKDDPGLADVRVLMLTARSGRQDVVRALEAGASDYVTKPFFIDELVARIRTNLEVKRYHDDLAAMLRITQAVSSSLDIDRVLYTIVCELAEVVQSDRASLIKIVDEDSGYVVATVDDPDLRNLQIDLEDYPEIREAAFARRVVVVDDTHTDPITVPVADRLPARKSVMIVPLEVQHEKLGQYVLLSSREVRPYGDSEVKFARVVASAAANGLANAALYEQSEIDNQRLTKLANTDDLTMLYNHRYFYQRLEEEFKRAERYGSDLSLILLDLDHFKRVNDTYGHQKGDEVLQELATVLHRTIRETDLLARYGGEEFAVLLPETNLSGAFQQAERLRRQVKAHYFEALQGNPLTISCGVACLPFEEEDFEIPRHRQDALIARADQALYTAKRGGRDRSVTSSDTGPAEG
ncbi:MAG: diguanylate cyclase [Gemmatimonadota bacterium]|nr:diguanylate cyclase [Gemmatimonadota bacterium]